MTKKKFKIVWTEHEHHVDLASLDVEAIAAVGLEEKAWNFIAHKYNFDGLEDITIDEINEVDYE